MLSAFQIPEDIANRGCQHIGAERFVAFSDPGKAPAEMGFMYHKLRQAELRRNAWRFSIKRCTLRAIATTTRAWTPPVWAIGTTYGYGTVVSYIDTLGTPGYWLSNTNGNVGSAPGTDAQWTTFAYTLYANLFDDTEGWQPGEIVYETPGDGTYKVYLALQESTDDPSVTDAYDATITYTLGNIVVFNSQNYVSLVDLNLNQQPDTHSGQWATTSVTGSWQWVLLSGTLSNAQIMYPLGAGPVDQTFTRNAFPLPAMYLKTVTQDPKAGTVSILGSPTNDSYKDWEFEGNFIVSMLSEPMFFRFVLDVRDVTQFDAMFSEGLGCRLGMETCEAITQDDAKKRTASGEYVKFMGEARLINAIEIGEEEPPIDDYISTRL